MANKVELLIEDLVNEILPEEFELVDSEYVKEGGDWYLRIYLDRKKEDEYLSMTDCHYLTTKINEMLDEKDPIENQYILEVSSPGLDRALKKDRDFAREKGKEVEIKLYKPVDGRKEFDGILIGLDEEGQVQIESNGKTLAFNRKDIAIIRLKIVF